MNNLVSSLPPTGYRKLFYNITGLWEIKHKIYKCPENKGRISIIKKKETEKHWTKLKQTNILQQIYLKITVSCATYAEIDFINAL